MKKNSKVVKIELTDNALDILKEVKKRLQQQNAHFIFNDLDKRILEDKKSMYNSISSGNALTNKRLKEVAKLAKISKNISFHIARHSFASIVYSKTTDIEQMQRLLKHSSIRETQGYIASLNSERDSETLNNIFK